MILKSVGVLSIGKIFGAMGVLIGLLIGGVLTLLSLAGVAIEAQGRPGGAEIPAMFFGVASLITMPLFYGLISFITGIIYAVLYNMLAAVVGGIELEFDRPTTPVS